MNKLTSLLNFSLISLLMIGCKAKVDKSAQQAKELESFRQSVNEIKPKFKER